MGLYYKSAPCPTLLFIIVFFKVLCGQACSRWRLLADGIGCRDGWGIRGHAEVMQRCQPCLRWILDRQPLQCKEQPRINDGTEPMNRAPCWTSDHRERPCPSSQRPSPVPPKRVLSGCQHSIERAFSLCISPPVYVLFPSNFASSLWCCCIYCFYLH